MAEPKAGDKFVVLHSAVDGWTQGEVVAGAALGEAKDRLLGLKAIRHASAEEAGQSRVDVSGVPLALSPLALAELAAKDADIERLTQQVAAMQERSRSAAALATSAPPPVAPLSEEEKAHIAEASKEKDERIKALEAKVKALEAEAQKATPAPATAKAPPPTPGGRR